MKKVKITRTAAVSLMNIEWLNRGGVSLEFFDRIAGGAGKCTRTAHEAANRQLFGNLNSKTMWN